MSAVRTSLALAAGLFASSALAGPRGIDSTIGQVAQMPWNAQVTTLAGRHGLSVVNVTWEDTGRSKGSALGPNITDMTIGVRDSSGQLHPMPVFRFDNFTDVTADLSADAFHLPVGNAWGADDLQTISLSELLQDTRRYLHDPRSWGGQARSLWDDRDEGGVLVSAQACFLPVPKAGEATFTPVVYNYQSSPGNPAVLTIIATREGTSLQVVENDSGYMSEPLFFNADGERAPFTAVRASDVASGRVDATPGGALSASGEDAANVVVLVQVPLKHKSQARMWDMGALEMAEDIPLAASRSAGGSDVENAVIGHGPAEGPYRELRGLPIERDDRFPVRVTVQFYKATSNGVVTDRDVADIRAQIDRVYADSNYVSSLVTDGYTGRTTEWVDAPEVVWADHWFGGLKAF